MLRALTLLSLVLVAAPVAASSAAAASQPLTTSVLTVLPSDFTAKDEQVAFQRVKDAGASMVRLTVDWSSVAPAKRPAGWRPTDPAEPSYDWDGLDQEITQAVKAGLAPYLTIQKAPRWAQHGKPGVAGSSSRPDAKQLALFATAVARRYGGSFRDLPRVRYFQLWNEENLANNLWPQLQRGKPVAPAVYRTMLNAFYRAIHGVHANNVVVSGGLAPFRDVTPATQKQDADWGPLSFMRSLLCLSKTLQKSCNAKVSFDVWAVHPYTSGGPTHEAQLPNDVSLGDLPEMKAALDAARRHHTIRSRGGVGFWVTEFSWDSKLPDPAAVPMKTLRQWVPEALYQMWSNGVTNVTWFLLRDQNAGFFQSGLYYAGKTLQQDRPKPILRAFRFPLVALPQGDGGERHVWGRTPGGKRGTVVLEHLSFGRTTRVARIKADRNGIFQGTFDVGNLGYVRARLVGSDATSAYYALKKIPDRYYNPFGGQINNPGPSAKQ